MKGQLVLRVAGALCALVAGVGCGDDGAPMETDAGPMMCADDSDCDDGRYCTGVETCDLDSPSAGDDGCVPGERPCMPSQLCNEETDACETRCAVEEDADGDGHAAMACGGDDCDDADGNRFPGNAEVCDGENHDEDCDPTTFGGKDTDGDGFADARCCNEQEDGSLSCGDDCDDLVRNVNPDTSEVCDGFDNDCDETVDEGVLVEGFVDADGDGDGDPEMPTEACAGSSGFSPSGTDCDDTTIMASGIQVEVCDGVDNDCDGEIDENPRAVTWYRDLDGDGFGSADSGTEVSCAPVPGHSLSPNDCDDSKNGVNPAATEACNGIDDDCNGLADFAVGFQDFEDDDGDGEPDMACPIGRDCDDEDPFVGPIVAELCDGVDNDCDGEVDEDITEVDWLADLDGDGYGDDDSDPVTSCMRQPGRIFRGGDCDDSDPDIRPTASDICNGVDDDCDGSFDEGSTRRAFYPDDDGDGYGRNEPTLACELPAGYAEPPDDCDDADAGVNPDAVETCNGVDDDCDGEVDEGVLTTFYPDGDGDGYGVDGTTMEGCEAASGYAATSDDCDDADPLKNPGVAETCNGEDDDCDGTIDEMAGAECGLDNATAFCSVGECLVESCNADFADCDGVSTNGCEVDTLSSTNHCGGCGVAVCGVGGDCLSGVCDTDIVSVEAGVSVSCALRGNGRVVCWGTDTDGTLGNGDTSHYAPTAPVQIIDDADELAVGGSSACAHRTGDDRWWCWGNNDSGQIATGGAGGSTPEPMVVVDVLDVSINGTTGCAVRATGNVVCMGYGADGELGHGEFASSPTPVAVLDIDTAVDVAVGDSHACAALEDGTVRCWGAGSSGQLGDGTTSATARPSSPVIGITDAVEVAAGTLFSCARLSTGAIQCWGYNQNGRLGNGSTSTLPQTTPVNVLLIDDAVDIDAGVSNACAVRASGEVWCWGNGTQGRLGSGDTADQPTPGPLDTTVTDFVGVGYGAAHGCALRPSGELQCWGAVDAAIGANRGAATFASSPHDVLNLP